MTGQATERWWERDARLATNRLHKPHLRCGICDEPFEPGEPTVYVDDERCHAECAERESE
jgi:hypothetical protein